MSEEPEYGINFDFTSKTVVLIGKFAVDKVIDCMEGNVTPEKVVVAAHTLLGLYHPDHDQYGEVWSLGTDEPTLEHFHKRMGDQFVITSFKTDGGK